jgi:hypothetical protein
LAPPGSSEKKALQNKPFEDLLIYKFYGIISGRKGGDLLAHPSDEALNVAKITLEQRYHARDIQVTELGWLEATFPAGVEKKELASAVILMVLTCQGEVYGEIMEEEFDGSIRISLQFM